jgi:hypothetical protein
MFCPPGLQIAAVADSPFFVAGHGTDKSVRTNDLRGSVSPNAVKYSALAQPGKFARMVLNSIKAVAREHRTEPWILC